MKKYQSAVSGVMNINKPAGSTSHDVVARIRRVVRGIYNLKVGHTGTLDPFATGVLLVAVGSATRLIQFTHDLEKVYEATFTLGATSDTDDSTGTIFASPVREPPQPPDIERVLQQFTGTIRQVPPAYAAVKVAGKKLYEYARRGEQVAVRPRRVTIHEIFVRSYEYPTLDVSVRCSTGTYIRALARDIGSMLGVGGYCSTLERVRIGDFTIERAVALEGLSADNLLDYLQPPATLVAHLPRLVLSDDDVMRLRHGQTAVQKTVLGDPDQSLALITTDNTLVGVGRIDAVTGRLASQVVLS